MYIHYHPCGALDLIRCSLHPCKHGVNREGFHCTYDVNREGSTVYMMSTGRVPLYINYDVNREGFHCIYDVNREGFHCIYDVNREGFHCIYDVNNVSIRRVPL